MEWLSSTLGQITLVCGSWSVVSGSVWKLCERLEKVMSADARRQLSAWLSNAKLSNSLSFLHTVRLAFVTAFGPKHRSWFCVRRSLMASCLLFSVLYMLWLSLSDHGDLDFLWTVETLVITFVLVVFINGLVDYISLLKARSLLQRELVSPVAILVAVSLDFGASLSLGCLGFIVGASLEAALEEPFTDGFPWNPIDTLSYVAQIESRRLLQSPEEFLSIVASSNWYPPPAVWVYTTCLTSIWTALMALSALTVKLSVAANKALSLGQRYLNVQEHPVMALGAGAIAVVTAAYLGVGLVVILL
jgi:hypothetical protein